MLSSSGCIVVIDECVAPELAARIAQDLQDVVFQAIAVAKTGWVGLKDKRLAEKILAELCRFGRRVILITRDRLFSRSAQLRKDEQRITVLVLRQTLRIGDVYKEYGARIVELVRAEIGRLTA